MAKRTTLLTMGATVHLIQSSLAQTSTVSVVEFGSGLSKMGASVISAHPTATTYAVDCKTAAQDCVLSTPFTIVAGPSTAEETLYAESFSVWTRCKCVNSKPTLCTYSQSSGSLSIVTTERITDTGVITMEALTVTAGMEKLSGGKAEATTAASSKPTDDSTSAPKGSAPTGAAEAPRSPDGLFAQIVGIAGILWML